ncbi:MAG: peptide chain release factor N(5)-glutamine methyltransferase [Spirochaetaceae bacterium]|nr:MAG: peptide chain release factor N(5)-glutamine methyltransferase [Spirochaetaceae bacterium]
MTVHQAAVAGAERLRDGGIETAWLDAIVLLCHVLDCTKERLFTEYEAELDNDTIVAFESTLTKRIAGLPVSYIRRSKEFFSLEHYVDERVLVPRPDSELLVETALRLARSDPSVRRVHDCCTGSGCIAIALAYERSDLELSASDVSQDAIDVARLNARNVLGHEIPMWRADLLAGLTAPVDMITANPPYLTTAEYERLTAQRWPEPQIALDGGPDGLDTIRTLANAALDCLRGNRYLLCEAADAQADSVREIFKEVGFARVETVCDIAGHRRVSIGYGAESTRI